MNKLLLINIMALAALMVACGPSRNLPDGAPERMRTKELKQLVSESSNKFTSLRIRTFASFNQSGSSQSFRLEARIYRDSIIWLDIADPILGIKVARAILTKDSVAFYNRIDKEYITGDIQKFQEEFKLDFGFEQLQAILSANLIFPLKEDLDLYYRPGRYLFSDIDPEDIEDPEKYFSQASINQVFIEPVYYKPSEQVLNEPGNQKSYAVVHSGYTQIEPGFIYPEKIEIQYFEQEPAQLNLEIRSIERDDPRLNYPFNIPSGYAKMR